MNSITNLQSQRDATLEKLLTMVLPDLPIDTLKENEFKNTVSEYLRNEEISEKNIEELKTWLDEEDLLAINGMKHVFSVHNFNSLEMLISHFNCKKEKAYQRLQVQKREFNLIENDRPEADSNLIYSLVEKIKSVKRNLFPKMQVNGGACLIQKLSDVQQELNSISQEEMDNTIGGAGRIMEPQYAHCLCGYAVLLKE